MKLIFVLLCLSPLVSGGVLDKLVKTFEQASDAVKPTEKEELMDKPWFCHGLDCPEYAVVSKTADYEERRYTSSRWVSTTLLNIDFDKAQRTMFSKLFDYIQGENEAKEKIAMTAPVRTRAMPGAGPACVNNFTMSFYISNKLQKVPKPTNKDVFLSSLPDSFTVYVGSFGGYADQKSYLSKVANLSQELKTKGLTFQTDHFFAEGYDSPFHFFDRHNEVWLEKS